MKQSTRLRFLLAVLLCSVLSQTAKAQLPPRLIAYTNYDFESGAFTASDSTFLKYDHPNAYSQRLQKWLPSVAANRKFNNTGPFAVLADSNLYAYDNNGNTTAIIQLRRDANGWDTAYQIYYTYNGNNQVTKEVYKENVQSTPKWRIFETVYTYDSQNNLTEEVKQAIDFFSGVGQNDHRRTYDYAGGQPVTETAYDWNNGQWEFYSRTNRHFTNGIADSAWSELYDHTLPGFRNSDMEVLHLNGNNDPDTIAYYFWSGTEWQGWRRDVLIYNGNRNVVQNIGQSFRTSGWEYNNSDSIYYNSDQLPSVQIYNQQWDHVTGWFINEEQTTHKTVYYYDHTTHVSETGKLANALSVFPNPGSDYLTIQYKGAAATPISIAIHDATGRMVRHWEEQEGNSFTKTIDVSDFPQGQYILRINGINTVSQRFTIIH